MSEFEKELHYKLAIHDTLKRPFYYADGLIDTFKDWQPPKPLVEVPQFVADWFNINQDDIDGNIKALTKNIHRKLKSEWSEMDGWFMYNPNKPIETLIRMKLDDYTVEKEKKYILKHIDMSKLSNDYSLYLIHGMYNKYEHVRYSKDTDMSKIGQCHFTQSEIDELHVGSYEQIEVIE